MRVSGIVLGLLLVLIGLVWVGQGLGYIKGSFMTGASLWAWIGVATGVVGVIVVSLSLRLLPRR